MSTTIPTGVRIAGHRHVRRWLPCVNRKAGWGIIYNFDDVVSSYGRRSPIIGDSMGALQVWANGMTLESYRNMVAGSYGYILIHIRVYFLANVTIL